MPFLFSLPLCLTSLRAWSSYELNYEWVSSALPTWQLFCYHQDVWPYLQLCVVKDRRGVLWTPCRMGLLMLYQQQEGHAGLICAVQRAVKKESLPNQGKNAQDGTKGVSDCLPKCARWCVWQERFTVDYHCSLIYIANLIKGNSLIGASSWGIWSFREKEAFRKEIYLWKDSSSWRWKLLGSWIQRSNF